MNTSNTTITSAITKTLQQAIIAGIVTAGTFTAFTTSAQAMVVYNCVEGKALYVRLRGQTTKRGWRNLRVKFGQGWSVDTGRGEKFRITVAAGKARKSWSNHNGGSVYSLRRINGNIEVSKGKYCQQQPKPQPQPQPQPIVDPPRDDDGDDSERRFWKPRWQGYRLDARMYSSAQFDHPFVAKEFCMKRGYDRASYRVATARKTIAFGDEHIFRNGRQSNTSFKYIKCRR